MLRQNSCPEIPTASQYYVFFMFSLKITNVCGFSADKMYIALTAWQKEP